MKVVLLKIIFQRFPSLLPPPLAPWGSDLPLLCVFMALFIDKILRFLTISTDFQIVFLSKYSEENFQKSVQPVAPKYFVLKFLRLSEKIGGFKIFRFLSENFSELRFILIGLSPGSLIPNVK